MLTLAFKKMLCMISHVKWAILFFMPSSSVGMVWMVTPWAEFRGVTLNNNQRWSRGQKARGQGQGHKKNPRPRPRTAFPRTDTLEAKDRNARGQGQGSWTQAQVLSKKIKKKGLHKNFSGDLQKTKKKGLHKNFSSDLHKKTFSKKIFKRSTKF